MTKIDEIVVAFAELAIVAARQEDELSATREKLHDLRLAATKLAYGVGIGDLVRRSDGAVFRVTGFPFYRASPAEIARRRPWVMGVKRKKDGSFVKKASNVYEAWVAYRPNEPEGEGHEEE